MSGGDDALPRGTERWVEALTWHETLTDACGSHLTTAVIREWQAWYSDPENQRLFEHLTRLVSDGRAHPQRRSHLRADIAADDYDLRVPIEAWRSKRLSQAARGQWLSVGKKRPWLAVGAAAVAMAAITALISQLPRARIGTNPGGGSVTYWTDVGGLKDAHLEDGSEITLGGRTKLVVTFSAAARSANLIRGEAWFRVAHDPKWPFVVRAGDGAIRDVGTAFLVTRDSDRVVVTVTEGTVAVTTAPRVSLSPSISRGAAPVPLPPPVRLTGGEQVSYHDNGDVASVVRADANAATAWIRGRLIFDGEPLQYVVESINRYSLRRIAATPAAGRIRFSGVILDGEIEEWLRGLPAIVPVDIDERGAGVCIRMRADQETAQCADSLGNAPAHQLPQP